MKIVLKKAWQYVVLAIWFVVSICFFEMYLNKDNTDLTKDQEPASIPVICVQRGDYEYNRMFGYSDEMDYSLIRDGITVLEEGRTFSFRIYKKDNEIEAVNYELRSIDKKRFVEEGEVENIEDCGNYIDAKISLKDIILDKTEYSLQISLLLENGKKVTYYARVCVNNDIPFDEMLEFPFYFSECTFDKTRAEEELDKYMESNGSGDNTDFNRVDIHSSMAQLTWGSLIINRISNPVCRVDEIDQKSAEMTLEYTVNAGTIDSEREYYVRETYRFIKGTDRIHLMDFERNMEAVLFADDEVVFGDKLMLGIRNDSIESMESEDGNTYAFVNEGALFIVNSVNNTFGSAYSFYDRKNADERTLNQNHDIKILNIDETGNVLFMVYGYFNGGDYEGRVGINLFEYNAKQNVIEEKVFIGCNKPYEAMKDEVDKLSYVNNSDDFYIFLNNTLYSIDIESTEVKIIAENLEDNEVFVSYDNNVVAFISGKSSGLTTKITIMNLDYNSQYTLAAKTMERFKALGFMGEDLIYGKADFNDISEDIYGEVTFPMNEINIVSKAGTVLKTYSQENIYVMNCKINENLITLTRMQKDEEGNLYSASPDSILNTQMKKETKNKVEVISTENLKKIVQIALKNEMDSKKIKVMTPKIALYEGHKNINLYKDETKDLYYVYKGGAILGRFYNVSDAIKTADENFGCVLDAEGHYIWKKQSYSTTNQIMRITGSKADDENSSFETCLETVLDFYGYNNNVKSDLSAKKDPNETVMEIIPDSMAMTLRNVSTEELKYYLNRDIPVIVMAGEQSVLLIGYSDSVNVWMNPQTGNIMKVDVSEAERFYEQNGYCFMVVEVWKS